MNHSTAMMIIDPEYDQVQDLELSLPQGMDNLEGLLTYEGMAYRAYRDMVAERTALAYSVYTILEYELYRHRVEPVCPTCLKSRTRTTVSSTDPICPYHGQVEAEWVCVYNNQKEYLVELKNKVNRHESTLKLYKQAMRIAANHGFDTVGKVLERGGVDTFIEIAEKSHLDRETGEVQSFKHGHAPNGKTDAQHLGEFLQQDGPDINDPEDIVDWRYRLRNTLQPVTTRIWFVIDKEKRRTLWHKEVVENGSPTHWGPCDVWDPDTPEDVFNQYLDYLKIPR